MKEFYAGQSIEVEVGSESLDSLEEMKAALQDAIPQRVSVKVEQPKTFFELVESKQDSKVLSRQKLRGFLNYYGVYPEKHRYLCF